MRLKLYPLLYILSAIILFSACKTQKPVGKVLVPAVDSKKVYKSQIDSFIDIARLMEPVVLADSLGNPIPLTFVSTVNFNLRRPNYVIIHHTAQDSLQQTITTFTLARTQVSAHYVVGRDGKVVHMLNDYLRAFHAGVSRWGSITDMNSCSIGIEIDNNGNEPYSDVQIKSLLSLLAYLKKTYAIPTTNFIGHADIAPARKPDPSVYFPWKLLAQKGFGYWSDDVLELAPENFDYVTALRIIGYNTTDLRSAIIAFKRHFIQTDITPVMTQLDLNVLYNVYKKY